MKSFIRVLLLSAFIMSSIIGNALAVPLPVLDYSGNYFYNASTGILSSGSFVDRVRYTDNTFTSTDTASEYIIGADVNINTGVFSGYDGSGNALFGDGTFSITDSSGTYLSANLIGIVVKPFGDPGTINPSFSANLSGVTFGSHDPSRFINELSIPVTAYGDLAATRITLDILTGGPDFYSDSTGNVQGKVAPVPEPASLILIGSGLLGMGILGRKRVIRGGK